MVGMPYACRLAVTILMWIFPGYRKVVFPEREGNDLLSPHSATYTFCQLGP